MGKEETLSMCSEATFSGEVEEKIFVSVRLRPLNQKEWMRNDSSDWECIDNTTIVFKSTFSDRSLFPTAYTFDRVFGSECPTEQVYQEAAKDIALSVVSGINSSIFAYGQTSSGKTYTMSGVTKCAIADIFEYIDKHQEREFVLKFSAMEIYNEQVRDLLSSDCTPLRLLDDPEKGTVVGRLIEETLEDWSHLEELLSICEAQRQIGETSLNETSSRSHQIIRLTVESSARNYLTERNSSILTATVNFVDLAGSERASQTLAAGVRLKEGSHINRSLLTLGTVIRKLSKGRNGHVPYRDSKLTRILQNSLGGNARTAIICTISPACCHIEQSRNTLLFATCAKEVTTNAQVNLVISDKALVKQLQKELARLESQLSSIRSMSTDEDYIAALREKELLIEEMNKEISDLTKKRDLAQFHAESLLKSAGDDQNAGKYLTLASSAASAYPSRQRQSKDFGQPDEYSPSRQMLQMTECPEDDFLLDNSTPKFTGLDLCESWEDIAQRNDISSDSSCKDVQCIETRASSLNKNMGTEMLLPNPTPTSVENENALTTMQKEESSVITYNALKQKVQELHQTINNLQQQCPSETENSGSKGFMWSRSKSRRSVLMMIPSTLWCDNEDTYEPSKIEEECHDLIGHATKGNISRTQSQDSLHNDFPEESMSTKVIDVEVDDTASVLDFVAGMNAIAAVQAEKDNANPLVVPEEHINSNEKNGTSEFGREKDDINWSIEFEGYQRKIIELWLKCNVSLVHRSCFFLFFKGDPSDNVYIEVELRRLQFLQNTFSCGNDTNKGMDSRIVTLSSSLKALNREREMLAKQIQKKLTRKEREDLYRKWNISLESKRRSLKLVHLLWTDTSNMKHIKESAALVAKLVGLIEQLHVPKEMFGLCLSIPSMGRRSSRWRDNMSPLL